MTTTCEILQKARELIATPATWTQGAYARNGYGDSCPSLSEEATCYCSIGAVRKAASISLSDNFFAASDAERFLEGIARLQCRNVVGINDGLGHEAVLEMFDKALEGCKP